MTGPDNAADSVDGRIERAKDRALGSHDSPPSHLDEAGEGVGAVGGVLTGAAIGLAGGPIGAILGGIAGAVGGWWAGRAVTEAVSALGNNDDEYYRAQYDQSPGRLADRSYETVRPAYLLGHVASQNPEYADRDWTTVEQDLQRGWSVENARLHGDWSSVRPYASQGFERGRIASRNSERAANDPALNAFDRVVPGEERR